MNLTRRLRLSYTSIRVAPIRDVRRSCQPLIVENRKDAFMKPTKTLIALCFAAGSVASVVAAPAAADVYVRIAPPAPRYEAVPVVQRGWVWAPGYWNWSGRHYVWVSGHKVHAHGHGHWVPDRWVEDHGRWRREHGHWNDRR
jgi:hypothetical protein